MYGPGTPGTDTPTVRSHAYALLRTILGTAASDGKIGANPCVIRGAGATKRKHTIRPASLPELAKLTGAMPEPYQAVVADNPHLCSDHSRHISPDPLIMDGSSDRIDDLTELGGCQMHRHRLRVK